MLSLIHISSFSDPLLDCKECKMRHRADTLIENFDPDAHPDKMTKEEMFCLLYTSRCV